MKFKLIRKTIAAVLLFMAMASALASCGYNDQPLPKYEYPDCVNTNTCKSLFSSSKPIQFVNDEQQIKVFIDMLNDCQFKETELKDIDVDDYLVFNFIYDTVIYETELLCHTAGR